MWDQYVLHVYDIYKYDNSVRIQDHLFEGLGG